MIYDNIASPRIAQQIFKYGQLRRTLNAARASAALH
jgi:hypothetical protein